jgi:ATP-dependent DNA helicase RecQ
MVHGPGDIPQLLRFIDDSNASEEQKRIERGKLETLIGFTEASGCRRQVLLRHFGEELAEPCDNCDGCLEPQALMDVSLPVQKLLSAVYRTGQRFGAAHVVDVLLGGSSEKIRQLGHDQLSVYGIGRELDRGQWRALVRQLLSREVLLAPAEARGGLCFGAGERVRPLLRGEQRLELALPAPRREQRRQPRQSAGASGSPAAADWDAQVDASLLAQLKEWRREQARLQGVPPYVVFHDRTLLELAALRPADMEALAQVSGIGAAKLERYGEAVLTVVRAT